MKMTRMTTMAAEMEYTEFAALLPEEYEYIRHSHQTEVLFPREGVAIKVLLEIHDDETFWNEVDLQRRAAEQGLAPRIHDACFVNDWPPKHVRVGVIWMDAVDGTLEGLLKGHRQSEDEKLAGWMRDIRGLHEKLEKIGILHGDTGVCNTGYVMVGRTPAFCFIDFGQARESSKDSDFDAERRTLVERILNFLRINSCTRRCEISGGLVT